MTLFADTGGLAALHIPGDPHHPQAIHFLRSLPKGTRLVTSNLVFVESVTLMASRRGQDAAVRFADGFLASRIWDDIYHSDEWMERAAIAVMRKYRDKRLSFTDAATIATVHADKLDGVFGFDEDFERCGVRLFP